MIGRTPAGMSVVRPVRAGVVADFEATEQLLRHLLQQAGARSLWRPRVLVCIPSGTTEVERRAVQESARAAGAGQVGGAVRVSSGRAAISLYQAARRGRPARQASAAKRRSR